MSVRRTMLVNSKSAVVAAALILCCCQSATRRSASELADARSALRLSILPDTQTARRGADLGVTYTLVDGSSRPITICLASGRWINFWGIDQRYAEGTGGSPDHAFCERKISLKPAEQIQWRETIHLPMLPVGKSRVYASVEIVSLANCDRYGCDSDYVLGRYEPLIVTE